MNNEIRQGFLDLYREMMLEHLRYYANSMMLDDSIDQRNIAFIRSDRYKRYGRFIDQIRGEIEGHRYTLHHQNELRFISESLKGVDDSELFQRLQEIIDALGDPSPPMDSLATFTLPGRSYSINFWYEHLVEFCKILRETLGDRFDVVLRFRGSGDRVFFSRNPDVLRRPKLIPETDIYVEVNLNRQAIMRAVRNLAEHFGVEQPRLVETD